MDKSDLSQFGGWDYIRRLLPTAAILLSIEIVSRLAFPVQNPSLICLLAVACSAFAGGWRIGIGSFSLTLAYSLYFFSTPGKPLSYTSENLWQLLSLTAAALSAVLLARWLGRKDSVESELVEATLRSKREVVSSDQAMGKSRGSDGQLNEPDGDLSCEAALCYDGNDEALIPVLSGEPPTRETSGGVESVVTARNVAWRNRSIGAQQKEAVGHKQNEASLRQGNELLRGVIEGTPDAVYVKGLDDRYLVINPAGARLLGSSVEEIVGKDDSAFCSPETARQIIELDRRVVESGEAVTGEMTITVAGEARTFLTTRSPCRDQDGKIIGLITVLRDITERQRAAEHLENSRAQLRALSARLQSVREEERRRIAREVHDELGQLLTGLKMEVSLLARRLSSRDDGADHPRMVERAKGINELIDSAIQTVRRIATELRPGLLDTIGLTAAIEWHAEEFKRRTGIKCHLKFSPKSLAADQERSIAIFRIFQEILTNIARHAQATRVDVTLEERGRELILTAHDNGRGITASEFSNPKSLGLLGMRERALLLGGEVSVRGAHGGGTTVIVRIPVEAKSD